MSHKILEKAVEEGRIATLPDATLEALFEKMRSTLVPSYYEQVMSARGDVARAKEQLAVCVANNNVEGILQLGRVLEITLKSARHFLVQEVEHEIDTGRASHLDRALLEKTVELILA